MSVAIDTTFDAEKGSYDTEFEENHTVEEHRVSTCTFGGSPCITCY